MTYKVLYKHKYFVYILSMHYTILTLQAVCVYTHVCDVVDLRVLQLSYTALRQKFTVTSVARKA